MAAQAVAVELFSTSILSNHKIRNRHERYVSILQVKKIPFVYHDLASDEDAKSRWKRKALDSQIPGLLVHNEWRGTFEEFEESIEFGELDLFLRIDQDRLKREADQGLAPQIITPSTTPKKTNTENGNNNEPSPTPTPRKPSKHIVADVPRLAQPRAPSMNALAPALPTAKAGYDKVEKADAEGFLRSLGIDDLNMTEEELNEVLEAGKSATDKREGIMSASAGSSVENADRGEGKYPTNLGLGTSSKNQNAVPRTYIPSAEAGVAPLRLAKMGNGSGSTSRSTSGVPSPHARYNASQISSRALAAEAQATASSRAFSTTKLREAISQGDDLKSAMSQTRLVSGTDTAEQVVGREDIDDLLASLGLDDVKMTDEEAEAFLFDGSIPDALGSNSNNNKIGRSNSIADRARNEVAAHDVAQRAREKGFGSPSLSGSEKSFKSPSVEDVTKDVQTQPEAQPEAIKEEKKDDVVEETPKEIKVEEEEKMEKETVAKEESKATEQVGLSEAEEKKEEETSAASGIKNVESAETIAEPEESTHSNPATETTKEITPEDTTKDIALKADSEVPQEEALEEEEEKEAENKTAESTPRQKTVDLFPAPPPLPNNSIIEKIEEEEKSSDKTPPASPPISPRKSSTQTISPSTPSKKPAPLQLDTSPSTVGRSPLTKTEEDKENIMITPTSSPTAVNNPASTRSPINSNRLTSPPVSAGHSSIRSEHSRSPPSSAGIPGSRTYNRRKGIDVPRRIVSGSPSSEPMFSPPALNGSNLIQRSSVPGLGSAAMSSSLSGNSLRSGGRNSDNLSFSPPSNDQKSPKSPKSAKKLLFGSIGRKSKDKRSGRKSGSSMGGMGDESEEDIPTTIDPNLIESRSSMAMGGGGGRINDSIGSPRSTSSYSNNNSTDRSQKTLSVILREADEALSGLDGDEGEGGEGELDLDNFHGDDDDFEGAFDLDIDLDGDDGMEVENRHR